MTTAEAIRTSLDRSAGFERELVGIYRRGMAEVDPAQHPLLEEAIRNAEADAEAYERARDLALVARSPDAAVP